MATSTRSTSKTGRPSRAAALLKFVQRQRRRLVRQRTFPFITKNDLAENGVEVITDTWERARRDAAAVGWCGLPARPQTDGFKHWMSGYNEHAYTYEHANDSLWNLEEYVRQQAAARTPPSDCVIAQDAAPSAQQTLNDLEETIVEALGTGRLTGEQIAKKSRCSFNSNFKSTLARLVRRSILVNRAPGYELLDKRLLPIKTTAAVS